MSSTPQRRLRMNEIDPDKSLDLRRGVHTWEFGGLLRDCVWVTIYVANTIEGSIAYSKGSPLWIQRVHLHTDEKFLEPLRHLTKIQATILFGEVIRYMTDETREACTHQVQPLRDYAAAIEDQFEGVTQI